MAKIMNIFMALAIVLTVTGVNAHAQVDNQPIVYHVEANSTGEEGVFPTIQAAVNAISEHNTTAYEIIVGEGTFFGTVSIANKNNIKISGAGTGKTIIAPAALYSLSNNGISIDNSNNITVEKMTIDAYANPVFGAVPTFRDGINYSTTGGNYNTFNDLEILNVDRRGVSIYPTTAVGNTVTNSRIDNVTGANNGFAIGIALNGLGTLTDNHITNVNVGAYVESTVAGETVVSNNVIEDLFEIENVVGIGLLIWPRVAARVDVTDNAIKSDLNKQIGMYVNYNLTPESRLEGNTLELSGDYAVGLDVINESNADGGYTIADNDIAVGKFGTGISLANVSYKNQNHPMVITGNRITNTGDNDAFSNDYAYAVINKADGQVGREVGVLISTSFQTKRVKDTPSDVVYLDVNNNTIEGFKEAFVYVKDATDAGTLEDIVFLNNRISGYQEDFKSVFYTSQALDAPHTIETLTPSTLSALRSTSIYKTTLFLDGDGIVGDQTLTAYPNAQLTLPRPSSISHDFGGWYADRGLSELYVSNRMPDTSTSLYAKWNIKQFSVQFVTEAGTLINQQTIAYGRDAIVPNAPARPGYVFVGWSQSATRITGTLRVVALYQRETPSVTPQPVVPTPVTPAPVTPAPVVTPPVVVPPTPTPPKNESIQLVGSPIQSITVVGLESALEFTAEEIANNTVATLEILPKTLDSVPAQDKSLLQNYFTQSLAHDTPTVVVLDISLFKVSDVGSGKAANTLRPITIQFELPTVFDNMDFEVLRVHDGVVDSLSFVIDPTTKQVSFETDRFSTYAIVEKRATNLSPTQPTEGNHDANGLLIGLAVVTGLVLVSGGVVFARKRKQAV